MAEDRIWNVVLNSLGSLEKKLDGVAQDVAAMRQASGDLTRRVERSERICDELQATATAHATALERHDRQLGLIGKVVVAVIVALAVAAAPGLVKALASVL